MVQMWYLTKKMLLCGIRSDVITGMDELKPLLLLLIAVGMLVLFFFFEKHVSIVKTTICAPDLHDPFMVVAVIY